MNDGSGTGTDVVPVGIDDYTRTQLAASLSQTLFDRSSSLVLR